MKTIFAHLIFRFHAYMTRWCGRAIMTIGAIIGMLRTILLSDTLNGESSIIWLLVKTMSLYAMIGLIITYAVYELNDLWSRLVAWANFQVNTNKFNNDNSRKNR